MSGIRLTDAEKTMVSRIVAYGDGHEYSDEEIKIAVKVAYIESSLGSDGFISGTSYDPDGSYRIVTDDGRGSIGMNDYAPDGSYSTYTNDDQDNIAMSSYAPDGSISTYANDGQGNITITNRAPDGSLSTLTDDGLGNIATNDYAADGSFSTYTDDGQGNIAMNDYAPDGTPVDGAGVIADDNSRYYPDSNYAQDNGADQASDNITA